jgi:hypothetical protein
MASDCQEQHHCYCWLVMQPHQMNLQNSIQLMKPSVPGYGLEHPSASPICQRCHDAPVNMCGANNIKPATVKKHTLAYISILHDSHE